MVAGARVGGLPLPARSAVILIIRGDDLLAPRDDLPIEPGDHVYLLCDPHDCTLVRLLFGHEEKDDG
jgi:cell volume regulation protein A